MSLEIYIYKYINPHATPLSCTMLSTLLLDPMDPLFNIVRPRTDACGHGRLMFGERRRVTRCKAEAHITCRLIIV